MTVKILKLVTTNIEFQEGMDSVFCIRFCKNSLLNLPGTE